MINLSTTLGDIVSTNERYAAVLDGAGLDYCCGGRRTLDQAAAEAGIDGSVLLGTLLRATEPTEPGPPWADLDAGALCDHITESHHGFLRRRLPELLALSDKVLGVHGERHPELSEVHRTLQVFWAETCPHLDHEEAALFPTIQSGNEVPSELVDELGSDHELVGALLDTLRSLTHDHVPPDDACASYQSLYRGLAELDTDTRLHVHKENNLLFPMVAGPPAPG
jgi:regulator of cell morphogenesis and NO signaling